MSHSPTEDLAMAVHRDYHEATRRLDRLVRAGYSWSGHEKNVALLNTGARDGAPRFADISALSGFNFPDDGRAAGLTDWDGDGDLDVWVMNRTAPQIRYLENTTRTGAAREPSFLMIRLEGDGRQCAVEATGTRVELIPPSGGPPIVRTIATGDTHCSQSTRWLHFGLGAPAARNARLKLTVRWTDGHTDTVTGLEANKHYHLKRGQKPVVRPIPKPTASPATATASSAASPALVPRPDGLALYSNRVPPPPLQWTDPENRPQRLDDFRGRPVALMLWASWCGACRAELKELAARARFLKASGITLVTLNIDAAAPEAGGDPEAARAAWKAAGVEDAVAGQADAALLSRLEAFRAALHWMGGPLRTPGVFLFDDQGRLVAAHEGVMEDAAWKIALATLAAPESEWIERALPFPGRHYGPLGSLRLTDVPQLLIEDEAHDIAAAYLTTQASTLESAFRNNREPGYPRLLYSLALHLERTGEKNKALDHYRKAVDLRPTYTDARYNLAGLLRELGQSTEALDHYSTLITQSPAHAASWHNRGLIRQEQGDLDSAITDFRQALTLAPASVDTMNNLANALLGVGQDDEALGLFGTAIAANPSDARTHYNHALALEKAVRWSEAADAYRRAINLDPKNAQYPHNLGVLFAKQSRWDDAESWLRQAIQLQPDHPTATRNLQRVLDSRKAQ